MPLDLPTLGFILIILGIILIVAGSLSGKAEGKVAVVGFIGPIPIGFGNDPKLLTAALVVGAIIFILLLFFFARGAV